MDIGSKIKKSRTDARITQEQAAEALGVSRQTVSNWENERSYPDIVSVLKMSDLYGVSLDYLLKGEASMKGYLDYIEESTNTVKSKARLSRLILVISYLVIWVLNIAASWFFSAGGIAQAQAGAFQWLVLPAATIILSFLIGKNNLWGKRKWLVSIGLGVMFTLSVYAGDGMRESSLFNQLDLQTLTFFLIGTAASLAGMAIGHAFLADEKSRQKSLLFFARGARRVRTFLRTSAKICSPYEPCATPKPSNSHRSTLRVTCPIGAVSLRLRQNGKSTLAVLFLVAVRGG